MVTKPFQAGYALLVEYGLHYDLQCPWAELTDATALARTFPETTIILNHTGLPADRSAAGLAGWRRAMKNFANVTNTAVKISGIGVPGESWTPALNEQIVRDCIEMFGPGRAMFASNFPVDNLCANYDEIFDGFLEITGPLGTEAQRDLFHDTAMKYYRPV